MALKHLGADFTLISVSLIVSLSRPFSFSLFSTCLLFCFFTLPSPWCPLVISTWNFPSCLILHSQSEHLLHQNFHQFSVLPRLPPSFQFPHAMLSPAVSPVLPSLKPTSVRGRHVDICATLPPTVVREILQAPVFHVLYSSNLQG